MSTTDDPKAARTLPTWLAPALAPQRQVGRAYRPDWEKGVATDAERQELAAPQDGADVSARTAQDYFAWRRAALAIGAPILALTAVVGLVEWVVGLFDASGDSGIPGWFEHGSALLLLASHVAVAGGATLALARWRTLRASHRFVRLGWLVGLLVPFALALLPVRSILDLDGQAAGGDGADGAQLREVVRQLMGVAAGFSYFAVLLPSVISVLTGAVRASLTVKRFLPESPVPGWIAAGIAPWFVLLLLAVVVVLLQIGGSFVLVAGFGLVAAAILQIPWRASVVGRPVARAEVPTVLEPVLRRYGVLLVVGLVVLAIGVGTTDFFGHSLAGMFGVFGTARMLLEFAGKSLISTVVLADLLLAFLRVGHRVATDGAAADTARTVADRIADLERAGLPAIAAVPSQARSAQVP